MILQVKSGASAYDIVLERGALNRLDEYLPRAGKALIVTDDGVPAAYARAVAAACEESMIVTLPQGERTKNLDNHRYQMCIRDRPCTSIRGKPRLPPIRQ